MFDLYARVAGDMAAHDFKKFVSVSGRFIATAERRPRATKSGRESDPIMMTLPPREFRWSPGTAACCGANPTLLEVLIEDEWLSDVRCTLSWVSSGEELDGTPLCAAAAAGRLEQVKLLLDAGEAVNDTAEMRSNYTPADDDPDGWANMEDYIVTPLYMALQKGHKDVAECLRARGGICYPGYRGRHEGPESGL